jgi:hypothetical protein
MKGGRVEEIELYIYIKEKLLGHVTQISSKWNMESWEKWKHH